MKHLSSKSREIAGQIDLPKQQHVALDDMAVRPLVLDCVLQVAGLHVNVLENLCGDHAIYVCTKVDLINFSPGFWNEDSRNRRWSVFSTVSSNKPSDADAVNDIFVFDPRTKRSTLTILGARFTKVFRSSLAKLLSHLSVNGTLPQSNLDHQSSQMEPLKNFKPSYRSQNAFREQQNKGALETSLAEISKSMISNEVVTEDSIEITIRRLLSELSDVPSSEMHDETMLEDLGIDSLTFMEIVPGIRQMCGINIVPEELAGVNTFGALKLHLHRHCVGGKEEKIENPASSSSESETSNWKAPTPSTEVANPRAHLPPCDDMSDDIAQILGSLLGQSASSFSRESSLADNVLDSLLCMELTGDIQKRIGISIDASKLSMVCTFGDLVDMPIGNSDLVIPGAASPATAAVSPNRSETPIEKSVYLGDHGSGLQTLKTSNKEHSQNAVATQLAFAKATDGYDPFIEKTGFWGFWRKVHPLQARLVVAYVVEIFDGCGCSLSGLKPGDTISQLNFFQSSIIMWKIFMISYAKRD